MKVQPVSHTASVLAHLGAHEALDLLPDGAYVTDRDRRIVFWNRAAERITGWTEAEVVNRTCFENVLVHLDKEGRGLCGCDRCPLQRSMVTKRSSTDPVLVFARTKSGGRTPVEVTVAPICDETGEVVGGIEIFRDLTKAMHDQLQAKKIQEIAMACPLPADDRVLVESKYQPRDLVGGDFYRIEPFGMSRYVMLLADVAGRGVSAALCTMLLRSLWDDNRGRLAVPPHFLRILNQRVRAAGHDSEYFGTAVCANYDAANGKLHCVRAGHSAPLLFRVSGTVTPLGDPNPALGMFENPNYEATETELEPGDTLLLFTEGAVDLKDAAGKALGPEGLTRLVQEQLNGAPPSKISLEQLEEQLLHFSGQIQLPDDLTILKLARRR